MPTPTCPADDGTTYTETDGSEYMIVCDTDFATDSSGAGNDVAITNNPNTVATFGECVDLCMNQGTICTGVTWLASTGECRMKTTMQASTGSTLSLGYEVDSAIRMSGPTSGGAPQQLLVNGDFNTGVLTPWTATPAQDGATFSIANAGQEAYVFPHTLITAVLLFKIE